MNALTEQTHALTGARLEALKVHRRAILATLLLGALGIAVNLAGIFTAELLELPLYLDSIGTILVAFVGGYMPGIATGFLTNLIASLWSPDSAYYGSLNVLIAVAAVVFTKRGVLRSYPRALVAVPFFALIGGTGGMILEWLMAGMTVAEPLTGVAANFRSAGMAPFWAQLCGTTLMDMLDKAITLTLALSLAQLIPERMRTVLRAFGWQQNPLSDEEMAAASQRFSRSVSLRSKILVLLAVATVLIGAGATSISYVLYRDATLLENTQLSRDVAALAASVIDAEHIGEYIALGEEAPGYLDTEERLYRIRESSPNIQYLYAYKITYEGCLVVFDLDTEELKGGDPGDLIPFDESFSPLLDDLFAGKPIDPIVTDDTYGWLLTAYVPVYDSSGMCQCYAAADISMVRLTHEEYAFVAKIVSLFLGFFILVLAFGLWLAEYNITLPINTMALAAGTFAYDSENARKQSIDSIHALGIRTGDEIEHLYDAFEKTTEDTVRYITDVQEKSEQINKLQSGLILVLADVVESRDHTTGDHIRKTAAYVKVILEQMRRDGLHPDILTDQYIDDVVQSAPLHDIGKISVPDAILNKPGKLTDEEYAQMKNHTTAGSDIIARTMKIVSEDSGYLTEAKNLAAYHHERWDGTGYPCGLKGEEIPLSARVMAVADVFDALVSRRSYKSARSVESVLEIIRDGSGKHFDPEVVTEFFRAEDEVRHTAEMHMESI